MPTKESRISKTNNMENNPDIWLSAWPRRKSDGHKYDNGHVLCISGALEMSGAIRLAAMAALRMGAGLVTIASDPQTAKIHAANINELMLRVYVDTTALAAQIDKSVNALIVGPGLKAEDKNRQFVRLALNSGRTVVLDAGVFALLLKAIF